jgi:hypothetical protein
MADAPPQVPLRTPMYDDAGNLTRAWYQYFKALQDAGAAPAPPTTETQVAFRSGSTFPTVPFSVSRNIGEKFREEISLADFGVLGDGSDEQWKVQNALDYAAAATANKGAGGKIRITSGLPIYIGSMLTTYAAVTIEGDGTNQNFLASSETSYIRAHSSFSGKFAPARLKITNIANGAGSPAILQIPAHGITGTPTCRIFAITGQGALNTDVAVAVVDADHISIPTINGDGTTCTAIPQDPAFFGYVRVAYPTVAITAILTNTTLSGGITVNSIAGLYADVSWASGDKFDDRMLGGSFLVDGVNYYGVNQIFSDTHLELYLGGPYPIPTVGAHTYLSLIAGQVLLKLPTGHGVRNFDMVALSGITCTVDLNRTWLVANAHANSVILKYALGGGAAATGGSLQINNAIMLRNNAATNAPGTSADYDMILRDVAIIGDGVAGDPATGGPTGNVHIGVLWTNNYTSYIDGVYAEATIGQGILMTGFGQVNYLRWCSVINALLMTWLLAPMGATEFSDQTDGYLLYGNSAAAPAPWQQWGSNSGGTLPCNGFKYALVVTGADQWVVGYAGQVSEQGCYIKGSVHHVHHCRFDLNLGAGLVIDCGTSQITDNLILNPSGSLNIAPYGNTPHYDGLYDGVVVNGSGNVIAGNLVLSNGVSHPRYGFFDTSFTNRYEGNEVNGALTGEYHFANPAQIHFNGDSGFQPAANATTIDLQWKHKIISFGGVNTADTNITAIINGTPNCSVTLFCNGGTYRNSLIHGTNLVLWQGSDWTPKFQGEYIKLWSPDGVQFFEIGRTTQLLGAMSLSDLAGHGALNFNLDGFGRVMNTARHAWSVLANNSNDLLQIGRYHDVAGVATFLWNDVYWDVNGDATFHRNVSATQFFGLLTVSQLADNSGTQTLAAVQAALGIASSGSPLAIASGGTGAATAALARTALGATTRALATITAVAPSGGTTVDSQSRTTIAQIIADLNTLKTLLDS